MFASAQLLRNWLEQRPSNQGDFDLSAMEYVWRVSYKGVDQVLIFLYRST